MQIVIWNLENSVYYCTNANQTGDESFFKCYIIMMRVSLNVT